MSGIAGIFNFDGARVAPGLVEVMTSRIAYRGRDGTSHWQEGPAALGHCHFRTTREALEEIQPLATAEGDAVLVMDGRVDNCAELRQALTSRGVRLRSKADAELVLHAYETWGTDCVRHIDGDFAFVVWDSRKREAFCARDRLGIRSLHYSWAAGRLCFASDAHALLALPGITKRLNEGMLAEFLAAEFHSFEETLWDGVLRLEPAHCIVVGSRGLRRWRYWEPEHESPHGDLSDEAFFERYRELFMDCVRRRCRSHVPVAVEVSGGLDSSAVWCAANGLSIQDEPTSPGIHAYTTTFTGDSRADELGYARDVARHLRASLHEVPGSHLPLESVIDKGRVFSDFPGYPNAWLFWDTHRKAIADGARVLLTGEGGDCWLLGSRAYYAEELRTLNRTGLADAFRADSSHFGLATASGWFLRHGLFEVLPTAFRSTLRRIRHPRRRSANPDDLYWLSKRMREAMAARRVLSTRRSASIQPKDGHFDLWHALHDAFATQVLERSERKGALAGIEYRHPYFDHRFVELAFATPTRLRLRGNETKFIHRKALRKLLPPTVLQRSDKAEFSGAFRRHLDTLGNGFMDSLPAGRSDWVSRDGLARLHRSYMGNQHLGWPIWPLWGIVACDALLRE